MNRKRIAIALTFVAIAGSALYFRGGSNSDVDATSAGPTAVNSSDSLSRDATMAEVLDMAQKARDHISTNLNDYTATFVKQEADTSGVLGEETVIEMKVQTRLRNETDDAPMRVYLKYAAPEDVKGREVLWGEDLNNGLLGVKEAGLLGFMTLWIPPDGIVAMQGQRYPISEIGLAKLVEKLLERGEQDRNNPDVQVTITRGHTIDDVPAELIQVRRSKPSGKEDDFSLAEISIDTKRQLILQYRSFGWPKETTDTESSENQLPLQEAYTYRNIKTNVGLTDSDFDSKNADYNF